MYGVCIQSKLLFITPYVEIHLMERKVYIDGELLPKSEAKVSVFDHGLLYGDGVFEGIRVYGSVVFRLKEHVERLYDSAKAICMEIPVNQDEMTKLVNDTVKANDIDDGYVRLVITRDVVIWDSIRANARSLRLSVLPTPLRSTRRNFTTTAWIW